MIKNKNHTESFKNVFDELKYVSNSYVRLTILLSLNNKAKDLKELKNDTKIPYSSLSNNVHNLEMKGMVYFDVDKYHLLNSTKLLIKELIELNNVIKVLDNLFHIIEGHDLECIPMCSKLELYLLEESKLLESNIVDVYKFFNYIDEALQNAKYVHCIIPVYHQKFKDRFNEIADNHRFIEIFASEDVYKKYRKNSKVKFITPFSEKRNFLLIITDKLMVMGFFRNDGAFDQTRLVSSSSKESLEWAYNLFRFFKKKK